MLLHQIAACWIIIITTDVAFGITHEPTCGNDTLLLSRFCAHWTPSSDWETSLTECAEIKSNFTIVDILQNESERDGMYKYLRKNNITSVWITVKQTGIDRPRTYQLPYSTNYREIFEVIVTGDKLFSKNIEWTRRKMQPHATCVLLTALKEDRKLRLQMENCSNPHPMMCISAKPDKNKEPKAPKPTDAPISTLKPKLKFRHDTETNELFLEVYSPKGLWNFTDLLPNTIVRHPACVHNGSPLYKDTKPPKLEYFRYYNWDDRISGMLEYSITKAEYKIITEHDGYLTCQGLVANTMHIVSSDKYLNRSGSGGATYSLALLYNSSFCNNSMCDPSISSEFLKKATDDVISVLTTKEREIGIIPVLITNRTETTLVIVYRADNLEGYSTDPLVELREEMEHNMLNYSTNVLAVIHVRSTQFCPAQDGDSMLTWPMAEIGQSVLPNGTCQEVNRVPILRNCLGDFIEGAYWDNASMEVSSSMCVLTTNRARKIRELTWSSGSSGKRLNELDKALGLLQTQDQLTISEIKNIANILATLRPHTLSERDIPTIANITNMILTLSNDKRNEAFNTLQVAQEKANSSNSILESLDRLLDGIKLTKNKELVVKDKFVTLMVNVDSDTWNSSSAIRGLATRSNFNLTPNDVDILSQNHTLDSVLDHLDVVSAAILPNSLISSNVRAGSSGFRRLVINLFTDSSLFGPGISGSKAPQHVLSVTLDGKRQKLDYGPLILLFRQQQNLLIEGNNTPEVIEDPCVFWDFQGNESLGFWSSTGCSLASKRGNLSSSNNTVDICICTHLTHFGKLLYNPVLYSKYGEGQERLPIDDKPDYLTYITIIGCSLSILGLLGIFITAVSLPEWRRGTGKKIQLHLSMASFILMMSFLVLAIIGERNLGFVHCICTGVLMHCSLLSLYLWMLSTAWYQYRRLAHPLESLNHTPHYLLITGIVAWGVPAVICIIILSVDIDSYSPPYCYPTGNTLLFSIFIPIGLILSINIIIFILILWSIFGCRRCMMEMKTDCQLHINQNETHRIIQRLISSVYLFSLLGLCWLFGFLQWQYLFCITATLQGLSFFVFFVVLDKSTRARWQRFLQRHNMNPMLGLGLTSDNFTKRLSWGQKKRSCTSVRVSTYET